MQWLMVVSLLVAMSAYLLRQFMSGEMDADTGREDEQPSALTDAEAIGSELKAA